MRAFFCYKNRKTEMILLLNSIKRLKIHRSMQFHTGNTLLQDESQEDDVLTSESEYTRLANSFFHIGEAHRCLIIQPYVKWGPKKLAISPEDQLEEAVALIDTLPAWRVIETTCVPLDNLERKTLFKSGNMNKLRDLVRGSNTITAVFVNSSNLKKVTASILQENFHLPILDRYKIVIQILKTHAKSKHAKLQVALAELHYIRRKSEQDLLFRTYNPEALKLMFQEREQKLKSQIDNLRSQRSLLRNKRRKLEYPVVAVVGYTNAGKTSIIKALTGEEKLQPKDQLFATLDVTIHSGLLPSGMSVLYVDTVGFISDIPTNLIECFVATLEDALLADVILHVADISSKFFEYKRDIVVKTLKKLGSEMGSQNIVDKVITVGNKCDLLEKMEDNINILPVSATNNTGLNELRLRLESFILQVTGRIKMTIKVPNGGEEVRWLYKNSTVLDDTADKNNSQLMLVTVIITQANLQKFKHYFI